MYSCSAIMRLCEREGSAGRGGGGCQTVGKGMRYTNVRRAGNKWRRAQ